MVLQALAFAWLGRSYQGAATGVGPARRCFQKALSIDPCLDMAGMPPSATKDLNTCVDGQSVLGEWCM